MGVEERHGGLRDGRGGGCVVSSGSETRVCPQVLKKLVGGAESLAAIRVTGDPVAHVRPAELIGIREMLRRYRAGRHEALQSGCEAVLLVVALRAAAGTLAGGCSHEAELLVEIVHAVLTSLAVRVFADGHESFTTGGRLDAGVADVRAGSGRGVSGGHHGGGVMVRERTSGERWSEGRIRWF